jgi:hypothetical protein
MEQVEIVIGSFHLHIIDVVNMCKNFLKNVLAITILIIVKNMQHKEIEMEILVINLSAIPWVNEKMDEIKRRIKQEGINPKNIINIQYERYNDYHSSCIIFYRIEENRNEYSSND